MISSVVRKIVKNVPTTVRKVRREVEVVTENRTRKLNVLNVGLTYTEAADIKSVLSPYRGIPTVDSLYSQLSDFIRAELAREDEKLAKRNRRQKFSGNIELTVQDSKPVVKPAKHPCGM